MSIIEHIVLFSLLFIVYIFWGKYNANRGGAAFWLAAIIPIMLYVFVVGSRYGWGADYMLYMLQYEYPYLDILENAKSQIVFTWFNELLKLMRFNYVGAYMVYSFIFITGAFVLLRSYGDTSKYMYCFLIPATLIFITGIIRQGVGLGFICMALAFFHNRKWLYMILAVLIAFNIHSVTVVTFGTIIGIFFIFKKPIHYSISIPLLVFFTLVFDAMQLTFIADLISDLSIGNIFQKYIDRSDLWFGENAIREDVTQGAFAQMMSLLYQISLFYLGYLALKAQNNKQVLYMYNVVVIGIIFFRAVFNFEILRRIASPMQMFYFIPLGYIFYVYINIFKQPENRYALLFKKLFPVGITVILAYLFMYWGRFILLNKWADFFWHH